MVLPSTTKINLKESYNNKNTNLRTSKIDLLNLVGLLIFLKIKMKIFKNITIFIMSLLYITVGIKHFTNPDFFIAIVPPMISWKEEAVLISGFIEVVLGILLLFKQTRKLASWGIILLLIAVFPANIYLYMSEIAREALNISKSQALFRMPFQIPLMIISYWHSKEINSKQLSIICSGLFIPTLIYFMTI